MYIGKLERVELRDLWKHEEYDFSAWLAQEENLNMLGDTIGIDMILTEQESHVGKFAVDILAEEEGTGNFIIIENQLEDTNHDHLGKIITYAAGKGAKYIIWIVKYARDEHRQAIKWLNEHTTDETNFFLLEIELWKIGNSLPAPKFNIVESPNDWMRIEKKSSSEITERGNMCLEFWTGFIECAKQDSAFLRHFKLRKPHPHHWFDISIGIRNIHISMNVLFGQGHVDCGLYVRNNKEYFEELKTHVDDINQLLGDTVEWREARKDCRLLLKKEIDLTDTNNWKECYLWFLSLVNDLKQVATINKKHL